MSGHPEITELAPILVVPEAALGKFVVSGVVMMHASCVKTKIFKLNSVTGTFHVSFIYIYIYIYIYVYMTRSLNNLIAYLAEVVLSSAVYES